MHPRNRRFVPVIALAGLVAFGVGACGDDDEASQTTQPTATAPGAASVTVEMSDFAYDVSGPLTREAR